MRRNKQNKYDPELYENVLGEPIEETNKKRNKRNKNSKKKKGLIKTILIILLTLLAILAIYFNYLFSKTQKGDISTNKSDLGITRNSTFGITNIVLYGLDSEDGAGSRRRQRR